MFQISFLNLWQMLLILFAALALKVITAVSRDATPTECQQLRSVGNTLFLQKRYDEADLSYQKALKCVGLSQIDKSTILSNRAQCMMNLGFDMQGYVFASLAFKLNPGNIKAFWRKNQTLLSVTEKIKLLGGKMQVSDLNQTMFQKMAKHAIIDSASIFQLIFDKQSLSNALVLSRKVLSDARHQIQMQISDSGNKEQQTDQQIEKHLFGIPRKIDSFAISGGIGSYHTELQMTAQPYIQATIDKMSNFNNSNSDTLRAVLQFQHNSIDVTWFKDYQNIEKLLKSDTLILKDFDCSIFHPEIQRLCPTRDACSWKQLYAGWIFSRFNNYCRNG